MGAIILIFFSFSLKVESILNMRDFTCSQVDLMIEIKIQEALPGYVVPVTLIFSDIAHTTALKCDICPIISEV